jgi:hydroxymethylglutaryl-CoA reductase
MDNPKMISGFSKLNKRGKIKWLVENFFKDPENVMRELTSYWLKNEEHQKVLDGFSENTISNFPMPFSVAPNFVINQKTYCIPMVIEESSVVAAASSAAKYWMSRGGFHAEIIGIKKVGQFHFNFNGTIDVLNSFLRKFKSSFIQDLRPITQNMDSRGGGIIDIEIKDFSAEINEYYQVLMTFDTCDSMGANFINTVLEEFSELFSNKMDQEYSGLYKVDPIMCILSNYTPDCLVKAYVSCPIEELGQMPNGMTPEEFAYKFHQAVRIAEIDPYRATTHNKGIFNGIDSVVIATGNDFRALEAGGHTYASRSGQYRSLSTCLIENGVFSFSLTVPLALGTVGGLTSLHPVAKRSLEMLGNPNAQELMQIIASVGLAQNFAAVKSLVTTGIQKGHMQMHLSNVLNQLKATEQEFKLAVEHFSNKIVSHRSVQDFLELIRGNRSSIKGRTNDK